MFIDSSSSTQNGKVYTRHLLRESFRQDGKVKHRTIANLSHCSDEEIAALKLALRNKGNLTSLTSLSDIEISQGSRVGALFCIDTIAHRLGLPEILGSHRDGKLALWQIYSRLINQSSRLGAVRLTQSHAVSEILGIDNFNEDHLYKNLEWLSKKQEDIEKRLFNKRYSGQIPQLFLYDVTSSYLEGQDNELAMFGYDRDKKKGKKQIVIGLLTGPDGIPVAVRVFEGNTLDPKTIPSQIKLMAENLKVKNVTIVGDRGMIKSKQINMLGENDFNYITAITKPQIKTLINKGIIQLGLFDEELCEIEENKIRYILRRNPVRQSEISGTRKSKVNEIISICKKNTDYLKEHKKALPEIALTRVRLKCIRLGLDKFVTIEKNERIITAIIDEEKLNEIASLDGCYVLKTDLSAETADMHTIHARYKDLAMVEKAFRTWKTGHLEVRPVFLRNKERTQGHVFVVMLAYLIEMQLAAYWRDLDLTVEEGIEELGTICGLVFKNEPATQRIPEPNAVCNKLLFAAEVNLPPVLPFRKHSVATRHKLTNSKLIK